MAIDWEKRDREAEINAQLALDAMLGVFKESSLHGVQDGLARKKIMIKALLAGKSALPKKGPDIDIIHVLASAFSTELTGENEFLHPYSVYGCWILELISIAGAVKNLADFKIAIDNADDDWCYSSADINLKLFKAMISK